MNMKLEINKKFFLSVAILCQALILVACGKGTTDIATPSDNSNNTDDTNTEENSNTSVTSVTSVSFTPVAISATDSEKKQMRISPKLTVTYSDGSDKSYDLSYQTILRSGASLAGSKHVFGTITDAEGNALAEDDGSVFISNNEDSNSLLSIGDKHYLVTHFENLPGALYKTEIKKIANHLQAVSTEPIDLKSISGTVINCAGSKTPWNTHLGGEESYDLNSRNADPASPFYTRCETQGSTITGNTSTGRWDYFCSYIKSMQSYLHDTTIRVDNGYNGGKFSPYNYGYIIEVKINDDGSTNVAKHYVTGKYTPELAIAMPDGKTFYMSDDGTAKGFYKFVSDTKITQFESNWAGKLFIAKFDQTSANNGGAFTITWLELGHASDNEIKALVESKMKLTDMFEVSAVSDDSCPNDFRKIYTDGVVMCLKLKQGKEKAAAFLETRKYGAYLGGTTEFRKEEGITYNASKKVIYLAISKIGKSMEDNYRGQEAANDIKLEKNNCGAVYELALDDDYSATAMSALVVGQPLQEGEKYADQFYCHPDSIANPDNIVYIGANQLLIGEDTRYHVNNYQWALDTQTKRLTRIASLPIGAEVTGMVSGRIDDKGPLFINLQHPFSDSPKNAEGEEPNTSLLQNATDHDRKGYVGYIDGIPAGIFE